MRDDDYSLKMLDGFIRDAIDLAYLDKRNDDLYDDLCEEFYPGGKRNDVGEERSSYQRKMVLTKSDDASHPAKGVHPAAMILEHDGERLTVAEWADRIGVPKNSLQVRLMRGWTVERALTKPFAAPRTGRARRKPSEVSHY